MKKFLTFLALCCLMVTGAWADGFQASTEVSPVKYVLTSAGDMTIAKDFTYSVYGANHSSKGEFAFIAAGETDTYYLYETITHKYLKLADGAQTSCTNGVTGTATKGEAQTFTITASDVAGKWWIKPTTMDTYLNFYGGWRAYTDNADAVGFYVEGADDGSRWDLTLADAGPVQYVLTSAANMSIATDLTYSEEGTSNCPRGRFSFISTGATDTYYLYENTSGKYVKLADGAVANGRNGVTFADSEADAQAFTVTPSDVEGKWWIKPTTMNTFLNFFGGVNQYKNTDKVGFYDHGNDNGSRWNLIEPLTFKSDAYYVLRCKGNNNYVTYNANANDGDGVNHLANAGNSTYSSQALFRIVTNGDQFNIIPAATPSQYVYAINKNDENSNVGIGAPSGEETAATEKYLWNITQVSDGLFTIIPKGGSLSWNCRGSVNGVNVIGQWNAGNNNSRWTITEAAPFEAGKTYTMTLNGKNVKYNASGSNFTLVSDTPEGNEFLYTIGGDPANGYTLYSVGAGNYIGHTKDGAYTADGADDAVASPNETAAHYDWYFNGTDVYLKIHGTNNNYLNDRGSLSTWNNGASLGNNGSKMTFTEVEDVPVTPDPVEEANTLTPASGETVESSDLANISVNFTGENAEIIWYDETAKATLTKVGSDPVESIEGSIAHGEYGNPFSVTFDTSAITGGTWRLNIPEGTFYIVNISTANTPIKAITATYTVAAAVPTAGKVYTIKAHFNSEELDDIYLSNDGTSMTFPTAASATQSYWVAVANDDSDAETCPWKFQSGYGDGKYLNVNGVNTTASTFDVRACDNQEGAGCYHLYNKAQNRNIGTFALNQTKSGWGSFGSGGCWSTGHNNGGNPAWTTDYIIEEVKNVDVYTVSGTGSVGVTGISGYTYASAVAAGGVLIVPAGTTLTDANFTNDANTLVVVDATAKTITLTEIIVTKPTSLDQIEQGVPYTITTYNRGAMIYTENGLSSTTNVGVDVDPSDPDQQFLFVEHHGQYYFYSVGGEKFINVTGKNENNNRAVGVDAPVNTSLIFDASTGSRKADFPIVLNIDGHHVGISNSFVPAVITHYQGTADDGNMVRLTPVLGTTVDLDSIIAKFPKICPIDAATYYVTIENHETGRQPFLFNDVQYADEITLQGASHDTSKNGYIWKVTSDGEGNITDIVNAETGKGIKPSGGKASSSITEFQYTAGTNAGYYNLINSTAITGGHDRLNASNGSPYVNEVGLRAVTTWNGAHNDNEWKFNAVDTEDLVEYNVVVSPAESRGYAVYGGKKAGNGGFFLAPEGLTQSDFAGGELRGFICDGVTLTDHTITLTYTAAEAVQVNYTLYLKEGDTETLLETAAEAVTEYVGQAPQHPFTVPDYVDVTYDQGVDENGLIDGTASAIKVVTAYNDLMPFTPGELTTVDIDIRNHYYFHVEERTITIDGESKKLWLPCISPKAPTFDDDAAYIWRMEGDWYHGFRFHNDQLAKEGEGDGTACHITYKHKEVMSETMEQMEGMKGETSLTEKTYTLESTTDLSVASRATLTGDADDRNSYFELVHATGNIQHYNGEPAEWQFRLMDHKNLYLNFRDYSAVGDNPDSLLCLYGGGYGDNASSFTFHKNEVCTEDDRQAVLAMIDAIEKGAVGALIDKDAQEYQDLLTLKGRIEDTTIGCTRALFDVYTEKLVKYAGEKKTPADGEAYRLAVRTKEGRNFYLKDDGTYTTDSLDAAIYVLGSSADGTKKILAGNNNEDLYYFRNGGLTQASYAEGDCDFNYELMAGKETVADVLDATGAAKYATVCLTDGNGKVATMTSPDKATATGTCTWEEPQDVVYMNDDLSSAIVMEPVPYPYTHPNFAHGTSDGRQGGFATIWLPFPMHFPDGIEVYKGTYMRDAKTGEICPYLMLTEVDKGNVTAAGGYLLYNAEQTESKMKQLVLPAPANPEDLREEEDAAFIGSTENPGQTGDATLWTEKFVNEYGDDFIPYVLADKSKDGRGIGFFRYTGATYPKGKAIYLSPKPAQGEAPAECIMFSFDDVIEAIESLHGHAITSEIYDLQGHRLNKVQKGQINVINGTKVMFK